MAPHTLDIAGGGIFGLGTQVYILVSLYQLVFGSENDFSRLGDAFIFSSKILVLAVYYPNCLLGFCVSSWCIVKVITEWHGNINRRLLLKLLEAQQTQSTIPGKAP